MENLMEKLKTVDKKVWIGVGIGAAVLIIIIVALVIGGGNKPAGGNTQGTQAGTETEISTEVFGTEDVTEVLGTEMATETEMGTETEMTETEAQAQNQIQGGTTSNVTVTQNEAVNGVEQKPVTTTDDGEEMLGVGSKDYPYEIPAEATSNGVSITTVEVPAGKTLYYKIMKIGGMMLNISDSDLYIIESNGTRHDSSFVVESAMANEYVLIQIGNKGGSNKAFTINFTDRYGTRQNPESITSLSGQKDLSAGNEEGWYYKYTATTTGSIKFYIEYTAASDITVTNYSTSAQRNFESDDTGNGYIVLDVTAGDVIEIHICAKPNEVWEYPATSITWRGEY